MKYFLSLLLIFITFVFGFQIYKLYDQWSGLSGKFEEVAAKADNLEAENQKLIADLEYFSNLDNLAKELKSLFNYKKPGEELIIVIPKKDKDQ